ncbi:(Fe-S)-binding protein [Candidatus Pacearchaeota archaeon]|nr:(Fe-S)-binding protein [Candidatus Pacearchaeota archaeon]
MTNIEEKNTKEEILEIFDKCNRCGLCKELCPVFKVLKEEQYSPRAHAILLSNKVFEELVFKCSLCKACEKKCPFNLKICNAIQKARQVLNLRGKENPNMKEMLRKLENKENPWL